MASAEAESFRAALISGEYGNAPDADATILAGETAAQDTAMAGSALWEWKGSCTSGCDNIWSVYAGDPATPPAQNLGLIPSRVTYVSRIYPRATSGTLDGFSYDPANHSFTMTATAHGRGAPTILFLPEAALGNVTVTGAARLADIVREPDGTRLAFISPTGSGVYTIRVSPS